jgi:hypothetical protein
MSNYYVIFSIGFFKETKKIFSYEKEGRFFLPLYTDSELASAFQAAIKESYGDDLKIEANVCNDKNHLVSMLKTIAAIHPDLLFVSVNPNLVSGDLHGNFNAVEEEHVITDYIEHILAEIAMNTQNPE